MDVEEHEQERGGAVESKSGEDVENPGDEDVLHTADMSDEDLVTALEQVFADWTSVPADPAARVVWALQHLNVDSGSMDALTPEAIRTEYSEALEGIIAINHEIMRRGIFSESSPEAKAIAKRVAHVQEMIGQTYVAVISIYYLGVRAHNTQSSDTLDAKDAHAPWIVNTEDGASTAKPSSYEKLTLFVLAYAMMHNFRHDGSSVYEQLFVSQDAPTHAWKQLKTLEQFVVDTISKEQYYREWSMMLHAPEVIPRNIAAYLSKSSHAEFPRIERHRRYLAFRNGLYDVYEDIFMTWRDPRLTPDMVAVKFHDMEMPEELFSDPRFRTNPELIPTPLFDKIPSAQGIALGEHDDRSEAENLNLVRFFWGWVIGRCLYDLHVLERNHRQGVFIAGISRSGKSTIANILMDIYEPFDTETINSMSEPQYLLDNMENRFICMCTEVKKNFNLDLSVYQQMLEGTWVKIAGKYKTAKPVLWRRPWLLCGNEFPASWFDTQGALSRRMFIVPFPNRPTENNPNLERDILTSELMTIVVKGNRFYRKIVEMCGKEGTIDEIMPAYLLETIRSFERKTQPFLCMIEDHPKLVRGPDQLMLLIELKTLFKDFCSANCMRPPQTDDEELARILREKGCSLISVPQNRAIAYRGTLRSGKFVQGLGIRDDSQYADAETEAAAEEPPRRRPPATGPAPSGSTSATAGAGAGAGSWSLEEDADVSLDGWTN